MLCEVQHITFAFRTREGIIVGHVVVMTALSDMSRRLLFMWAMGNKRGLTKLMSITMGLTLNCWCIGVAGLGHCYGYEG